jgi:hypothetical protein
LLAAGQLLEIIFTFFTLNVLCEAEEPMLPEDEEPLEAELVLPLGLALPLGLVEELALSPAPLPSEPVIRTWCPT